MQWHEIPEELEELGRLYLDRGDELHVLVNIIDRLDVVRAHVDADIGRLSGRDRTIPQSDLFGSEVTS